jgi:spermidine synthase
VAAFSTAVLAVVVLLFVPFEKRLLTSGVYRSGQLADPASTHIMFYRDGRTASISVERYDVIQTQTISTNGKGDASMRLQWLRPEAERPRTVFEEDESTQVMTALLGLAHAPAASTAAVIGQGSGQTSHVMLGSSRLKELVTIEIEPAMIEGSRWFLPANRRVFEDPRSRLVIDDAKSYFAASQRRFDLILSEPSHPWVSGVSGLFSDEFYRRVKRHIAPDGVFCQWLELYEINDDLVLSVMAAIQKNFRHYELFMMDAADMFIVATDRPDGLKPDWSVVTEPGIATDLRPLPSFTPDLFEAMRIGSERTIGPLVREARPNSDFRPVLDLGAERARFLGQQAEGFLHLHGARFSLSLLQDRRRVAPVASFAVPTPAIPRIGALAISAALRTNPFPAIDPAAVDERLPAAMERRSQLGRWLGSSTPPPDWRTWTLTALEIEDEWHGGSLGVVDERLHGIIRDYLARAHAPQEALQTFAFVHDLAAWDFTRAAAEADPLIERAARGEDWMPPATLLDGAFAARYLTGDVAGARRVLERLGPRIRDEGERTVMRLMAADLGASPAPPR